MYVHRKHANEDFLTAMTEMGITRVHAELALQETGGVGVEVSHTLHIELPNAKIRHTAILSVTGVLP